MKLKILLTLSVLFLFTTAANLDESRQKPRKENLNFDKEIVEIRLELEEANNRNIKLELATSTKEGLKQVRKNIKKNK